MYIEYDVKQDGLYLRGHEEGREEGIDIGKEKERLAIVIACLKEGDSYEKIARITGLDIKAIAKIDEERKKK